MLKKIKNKYRNLFISNQWIRLSGFYRFNKQTKQIVNIKNRIPNLVIVGSQKCGTTSLFHYLSQHPNIAASTPEKEPGFFLFDKWAQSFWQRKKLRFKNKKQMLKEMMCLNLTNEKYFMEATTYYTQGVNETKYKIPKTILNQSPDCKIIYIIRNPFQRLISNYFHQKRRGDKDTLFKVSNDFYKINTCLYYDRIKPFISFLGQDRVHVLSIENLKLNPNNELKQVYDFLELPDNREVKLDIHNATSPKNQKLKLDSVTYRKLNYLFLQQQELLNNELGMNIKWNLSKKTWVSNKS